MNNSDIIPSNDIISNHEDQIILRHKHIFEALNSINLIIHSTLNFNNIIQKALLEMSKAIKCDTAAISLREGEKWKVKYIYGFPEDVIGKEMNDTEELHFVLAMKTKKPVAINDALNDERVNYDHIKKWNVRSVLVVPLVTKDEAIGMMYFNFQKSTHFFDDIEIYFTTQLSSSLSLVLENSHLCETLQLELKERKQAEVNLKRSEALYHAITKHLPNAGIYVFDKDLRFLIVEGQESVLPISFTDKKTMEGKTVWDLDKHTRKIVEPCYRRVLAGESFHYETIYQDRIIRTHYVPLFDEEGKVMLGMAVPVDITEQKHIEEELRKSENRQSFLLKLSDELRPLSDPLEIQSKAASVLGEYLGVSRVAYGEVTDDDTYIVFERNYVTAGVPLVTGSFRMTEYGPKLLSALNEGRTITVSNISTATELSEDERVAYASLGIASLIGVPLNKGGRFVAELVIHNTEPRWWTHDDIWLLEETAERTWAAVERARAEEGLRESEEKFRTLSNALEEKVKERTCELEKAIKSLKEIETISKQEIHHRIKNNLQVISSLLDLQAEKFRGKKNIKDSLVLEAFDESQNRVISMALIHEELHKGGQMDTLNFSNYTEELVNNLLLSYSVGNNGIVLDNDIEEDIFFDMDTSVPLGMIISELLSNSLKHAFPGRDEGEIQIKLYREKNGECKIEGNKSINFILSVSDNGVGIPEDLDIENLDSLGLQLVTTLVDQLDGELELNRDKGTEFIIRFAVQENNNLSSKKASPHLIDND